MTAEEKGHASTLGGRLAAFGQMEACVTHTHNTTQQGDLQNLDQALEYLHRGLAVIPLRPGEKTPALPSWERYKTNRPSDAELAGWFRNGQDQNLAIITGAVSGVIVLDIDGSEGQGSIAGKELPPTPCVKTPRGTHYYYKHPGYAVRNFVRRLPGVDLRGDGGYVVAPPSQSASGARWEWVIPLETELAQAPAWLLDLLEKAQPQPGPNTADANTIPEGRRNATLASLAGTMRRRGMSEAAILAAITAENAANCKPPLPAAELATIAHSMARYEPAEHPTEALTENEPTETQHLTDLGNARRLVARHGRDLLYCATWGSWLVWDGTRWAKDQTQEVERRAVETVASIYREASELQDAEQRKATSAWAMRSEAAMRQQGMIRLAQSHLPAVPDNFDQNGWLLNVQNGTVDLHTGELRPQAQEDRITKLAPVTYDPAAQCPRWLAFLDRIMAGNQNLIQFLQAAVGYSLTADTTEQCFIILYGTGANGKSTFLEAIGALLGDYALTTPTETLLAKRYEGGASNDLARLRGARLVTTTEVSDGRHLAEAKVKQMTGGDTISARFLWSEHFEFRPTFKLWLATNHKPSIRGTDLAIWRRIRLVPFVVSIPEAEQDKHLGDKLHEELPGILQWALEGCQVWHENGLPMPAEVQQATAAYRAEQDTLAAFLDECCQQGATMRVGAGPLYQAYVTWCQENGEHSTNKRTFGLQMTERNYERRHERTGWAYLGIGLQATPSGGEA